MQSPKKSRRPRTPRTPKSPTAKKFSEDSKENEQIVYRKKYPFNLISRGVAGIEEMQEYLDDEKTYFALLQIQIGSGSFVRNKNIFIHFNGEKHSKPLLRSKENKLLPKAQKMMSPYHAQLVMVNKQECTIDSVLDRLKNTFTSDNITKGESKFDIQKLKNEYKKQMREKRKKAKEAKEKLEKEKQKLLEKQLQEQEKKDEEEKSKKEEEEKKKKDEEERRRKEAEERLNELKRKQEEEERRIEEEERKLEEQTKLKDENSEKKEKTEETKPKKKRRKKKDRWGGDPKTWSGTKVVKCIHAQTSPMNWGLFQPSNTDLIPMAFGHGDLNDLRAALKGDQVQYGIMRLAFGEGRFKRCHWVFILWTPDSMTKNVPQKVRKKRQNQRMIALNMQGDMQRLLGPYGVTVTAEDSDQVTIEKFIIRVRKTVVVDGGEELSAEAFKLALEAEKKHFQEIEEKKKKELEELKRLEKVKLEKEKMKEYEKYEKEQKEREEKRLRKKKREQEKLERKKRFEEEQKKLMEEMERERKQREEEELRLKEEEEKRLKEENEKKKKEEEELKKKNKKKMELQKKDMESKLVYESVLLCLAPVEDISWVLIEPRVPVKRGFNLG